MTKQVLTTEQAARVASMVAMSDLETEARTLIATASVTREWSQGEAIVLSVFKAMWSASLPVHTIENIGCSMHGFASLDLAETLTRLTKAGVLRSRVVNYGSMGRLRCYELKLS